MQVLSPAAGTIRPLSEVPDPVFAAEMVGPGLAVEPTRAEQTAIAPVAGTIAKLHPHAFAIAGDGVAVLVHLGIDTVQLGGEGFTLLAQEGAEVAAGQELVRWDPAAIEAGGRAPVVMVCVLDQPAGSVSADRAGTDVAVGDLLFEWPA
ncbi:PTS sugar transporter subunit IIA [Arsenicicoccus sp. oral taxon 190]|uniref:PTS sugar transporter subunit IIA n=1 Tax=Arsenicicoccus sp. oral taxon 190 TaxID=1658671 RepID=UPI00067A1EF7|nr:PTS glucose transporter subunit IIA [Arsenicicoccus sp. oral taxon 190]AKT52524.1 PTS glucose transporter subunit IIA [Arsenicicoccus sp. oral taxon 190]